MGTNFYLPLAPEVDPAEIEPLHIGKRSGVGGGRCSFGFQGHRATSLDGVGGITSWAQWRHVITAVGRVVDEYGVEHSAADFIAEVESTLPENRHRTYDWLVERQHDPLYSRYLRDYWIDADGFDFTFGDFS